MPKISLDDVISHWYYLFEGLQQPTQDFYARLEEAIKERNMKDVKILRTEVQEGGILSAKRLYLQVLRKSLVFDVCGAPFGNGFFVSWWLRDPMSGCLGLLLRLPIISYLVAWFVRPYTYYKIDTALMFQQSVHSAVLEVLDQITSQTGMRALSETERKPVMKEFFAR